jgi:hypothetical protein
MIADLRHVYQRERTPVPRGSPPDPDDNRPIWHGSGTSDLHTCPRATPDMDQPGRQARARSGADPFQVPYRKLRRRCGCTSAERRERRSMVVARERWDVDRRWWGE